MVFKQKLKLQYHPRTDPRGFLSEDVIIGARGGHHINVGDVIEVYHAEDVHHALFLVTYLSDELQSRDVISVEQSLAHTFKLQQHKSVVVNVIDKDTVSLDLVELYFRDQYFSRRDFYKITQKLIGTVVHVNKKLTCNEMRTQVGDLWRLGERYSCGFVDSKTKIIFRSSTAVIHIFIQMSQEMWWFDNNGDLYLEKAFKFLSKLFLRFWPENNCNHDTTVVFFTRIYIDDLPSAYSQSVKQDVQGRYYEDFYRVVIQNERFTTDDWKRELGQMQYEVIEFENHIYSYLRNTYPLINGDSGRTKLNICTAMDANLLEVLNMAINLYSGYNVDRNFDRTGKLLFVITPGSGVYHVNENLLMLTKKRVLDLGVGVDLICLAEQPLHAVPLFKILSESFINPEEYIAPHWINCSYFKSAQELRYIELGRPFPRVKVVSFKHSDDFLLSKNSNDKPVDSQFGDKNRQLLPEHNADTTITTTAKITKSSLPIYPIAYPSYRTLFNPIKCKKVDVPNELLSESLTKSQDSIINDCSSTTLDENRLHMISSITDPSSSVESTDHMPNCSVNCATALNAINTAITVAKARRASTSLSSHKNLSISSESDNVVTAVASSIGSDGGTVASLPSVRGGSGVGGVSHIHTSSLDRWQNLKCEKFPSLSSANLMYSDSKSHTLAYSPSIGYMQNSLSRVTSNHIVGGNNGGSGGSFATVTSLPSVRERCIENSQSSSVRMKGSGVLSIPMLSKTPRIRTQSFSGEQRAKLSHFDSGVKDILTSVNSTNYVSDARDNVKAVYQRESALSRCQTMDVMSDGQQTHLSVSSGPWNVVTHQSSLRNSYSTNRHTGVLSLSEPPQTPLQLGNIAHRKSTMTLYSTTATTTPLHSGKYTSNFYSRNSTSYAVSSLISGSYFPFGLSKKSCRIPVSAGQRRWALVRPSDEFGSTITPHSIITSTDDIDFMCPTPIPYNLCEIWAAYFDFLRAYLKDKSDSEDMGQLCNTNLFGLKGTGTTTNNSNNNSSHISSNTHQFNLSKANVYRSQKCLPNFNERSHENLNGIHNRIPPPAPPPPTPLSSHRRCHPHYQNNNENKQSNNAVSLKANACMNNQLILSVSQQHVSVLHDRLVNLSQLSENSFKALQVLLESVKNAMSTFSSTIPASSLSSVLTLSKSVSTLPTSGYFYYRKSQNFLCANNNSTDDQKLFGVHMNNRNNLYYKQLMPKRIAGLRKMLGRIGVDWKSLIVPACLPVDTDYFPDTNRLRSEWYILHDYRVVPSGMSPDEWALMNNDDLEPGAYYNRRQLTAREVFQEMVLQRISQGFQLCHEVVQHNPTSSNSVEHHHSVASINSSNSTVSSSSNGSTTNKILQNENASSNISPNDNKSQNKSLLKQNCERRDQRNMTRTTPHITYNNRISNTTANSASPAVSNTNTRRSGNVLTSRNPGPQLMKSSHHCHPARISSKVNHNNNPQCFKGSCMTSTHSGRVLGLGLSTNYPSNRSGNQSTASGRGAGGGLTATASIGSRSIHTVHNSSTTNSILSPLSKFGDTDKLLKTTRKLSIGHLFHLIALDEDSIAVTSYRQIDKLIKITYSYALQVPDAKSYVSLQTNFTSDSTVILNWNYLDNYLCNRGISDSFRLLPNLKFWRSRFFVLPVYSNETKRLTEAIRDNTTGSRIPCDVYEMDYINMNREKTCEKFVHFVESINRIRRTVLPSRKLNRQSATDKPDIHRVNTCIISCGNTLSDSSMPTTPMYSVSGSHKPKIGSITNTSTHARASAVSPSTIGSWNEPSDSSNSNHTSVQNISGSSSQVNITPTDDYHSTTSLPSLLGMFYQTCEDQSTPSQTPQHLSTGSASAVNLRFLNSTVIPYYMVALMMADNENGLPFISVTTTNAFPDYTFISIDAVNWIIKWFPDIGTIEQAVIYLQKLIETGWICHTSGNRKHAFIYGTYFYTLLIQDLKQANCCAQVETSLSLSAPDCVDLNIHSAPVTPIQSSASIANYTIGSSANTSQSISGLTSSVFVSTTTTITTASMCTANNCFSSSCFSSTANTTTTMTTATISANLASANTLGGNVNLPNTLGNTNSTTHINSSGSSISNIGASVTLTASNYMNAAASSSSSCSVTTTTGNSTTGSNNISSVGYGNLPLSTTKQNEFNIKSSDVLLNYFGSLPSMDLNLQNQQQQLQQPLSFPKGYIPKLLDDTTKWTCIFQNEWAEIAIVYYGTDEHQRRQHIRHGRCMNLNDSLNTTTNTVSSSDNTLTSRSTVTVNTTSNDALSSSSDCDFKSQTQSGISAELKNFKKDGLLKHSLISGLFGIPDKTGFQEIDQILRKSCLCDMDEPDIDGRVEWAHCVYDANYHPTCAFSIELQWLVVTGGRMAELVSLWHQKACTANLHFFPVPCYPFNQSKDDLSDKDPLRKPIFVPVNISVLIDTARIFYEQSSANYNISLKSENDINPHMNVLELVNYLFPGLSHAERLTCIRCFQDSILRRFGFISDSCDKDRLNYELHGQFAFNSCCSPKQWIYVHCSGGIFALIPLYETTEPEVNDKTKVSYDTSEPLEVHNTEGLDNSNDYLQGDKKVINMNMAEKQLDYSVNCYLLQKAIGYFWAWNHMLPRRWRGHLTGDESFQDGMLADFRAFLNGEDARLSQYFVQFLKSLTLQSM